MHRSSIQSLPAKTLARQAARAILADPWFSDPAQAPMVRFPFWWNVLLRPKLIGGLAFSRTSDAD